MAERAQGGAITKDQFMADADVRFQKLDANHDGKITPDEMQAMMQRFRDRGGRGGQPGGDTPPPPPGGPDGGRWHGHDRGRMFEKLDTNHDGRISREEMRAAADRKFDKMDTNHDGFIDKAESEAAHKMHRPRGDMAPPPPGGADSNTGQ
jgi:Ca2+-binding EF-hand superfamily protein